MTVDEFLRWAEGRPGRYELVEGAVFAMSPERIRHADVKFAVQLALRRAIAAAGVGCFMVPDGVTVPIGTGSAFEPDALVYCGPRLPGAGVKVEKPVVVVEVASPSTRNDDLGTKLAGYFRIPSLHHYLIVDPDRRTLIHHRRTEGDEIATRIVASGTLRLEPPGLDLALEDLVPDEA